MASLALTPREPEVRESDGEHSETAGAFESELDKNKVRLAKLERIKRKLKDRDSRLSVLVRESNKNILDGSAKPYEARSSGGADADDSKEAVRVLSYAAFKLQRQVDKKTDEALALRKTVGELEVTLQEREKEKSTLSVDMNIFRRSLQAYSDHIDRLALELDTKNKAMEALIAENDHNKQQCEEMKDRLAASRKDYEWMRTESMSKREQLEYFDYQLLAKNDEIDKLHQEIDKHLRRIVELQVDMEIMEVRQSRKSEEQSGIDFIHDIAAKSRSASFEEVNPADDQSPQSPPKRTGLFRLRELKCQGKAQDFEAVRAAMAMGISSGDDFNGSFPTDNASTATTAVMTRSTDGSSPGRISRPPSGKRNGKGIKSPPPNQQYIEMIDDLRSDLQEIEAKYKQDKYESSKLIEKLKQENNEYLIKLVCMDCKKRDKDDNGASLSLLEDLNDGAIDNSSVFDGSAASVETPISKMLHTTSAPSVSSGQKLPNKMQYLEKKVESLEGECMVHKQTINELQSKIAALEKLSKHRAKADKRRIDDLVFHNEAQKMQISELDRASRSSRSLGKDPAKEYAATLEEKIQQQSSEIQRMQVQNEVKDRTIAALRAQLVNQRSIGNSQFVDV